MHSKVRESSSLGSLADRSASIEPFQAGWAQELKSNSLADSAMFVVNAVSTKCDSESPPRHAGIFEASMSSKMKHTFPRTDWRADIQCKSKSQVGPSSKYKL